jgi:hypothetical protein
MVLLLKKEVKTQGGCAEAKNPGQNYPRAEWTQDFRRQEQKLAHVPLN